ncbi:MAG TPA: MFS transporter [Solirubrobacteraceae bacterium]|jgi:MFS family permease|nr:MFS transporter [Solirubrobacteraceae bacterium]
MSTIALNLTAGAATTRHSAARGAWVGFAVVVVSAVMDLLDSTIAQTAAPDIRRQLVVSYADLEWISAAYTLSMSALMILGSRLGDILGRRRILLGSIGGFVVTSALCAVAPSAVTLIGARVLQGAMAAMMVPQGFGLIRELFGEEGQQRAFGIFGPIMGLAAVLGPLAGGGLIALNVFGVGWRAIFLINVPIGLLALLVGLRHLPDNPPATPHARLDLPSVALVAAGGFALVYPLIEGRQQGWPAWSFALLGGGLLIIGAFALRQAARVRRGHAPLIEPSILKRRPYVAGLAVALGFLGAMGGLTLALNVMFQTGLGFTPLQSGLAAVSIPVFAIAGSITSSILLPRIGRTTMHIGLAVMAIGLGVVIAVLHAAGGGLSAWDTAGPLALTGFGMGMVFVPMFDVILAGVAPHELGSASGLLESVQQLAMSLGIAGVGTVLFGQVGLAHGATSFVSASADALLVAVCLLIAAWAATWWLPKHARGG